MERRQAHYIREVKAFQLSKNRWDVQEVWRLVRQSPPIALASDTETAIADCRSFLDGLLDSDQARVIYGVNTGFGDLAHARVGASDLGELQRNLLISHACGVGEDVPRCRGKSDACC